MTPLEKNPYDVPLAILYKIDEITTPGTSTCIIRGRIGVPDGHHLAVETADFNSTTEGLIPLLRKARRKITTVPVDEIFNGVRWQGFGDTCKFVSILPVLVTGTLRGFLVVGANPRRPVDEDYRQYIGDLSSKVTSIAAAVLSADEIRNQQDALQKELAEKNRRLIFMAQHSVFGTMYLDTDARIYWANDQYYKITEHPRDEESNYPLSFLDIFLEEDRPRAAEAWNQIIQGHVQEKTLIVELRLKRVYTPLSGDPGPAFVRWHLLPVPEGGKKMTVMTFFEDLSALKWAIATESSKLAEANEAKHQQEEFIDFISHELRNPLSAIFQLAETIISSYPTAEGLEVSSAELSQVLKQNIDHAGTILMCAKHQKRIVDDVLTLSKLEYTMLTVNPVPVQLPVLVEKWMKMWDSQLSSSNIKVDVQASPSLKDNGIDWILCDELRMQQIFINLIQNAIKFTKDGLKREITVEYGAAAIDPELLFSKEIKWAPNQKEVKDLTLNEEWGLGQQLYLTFAVTDTGIGMTKEEIKKLFGRFEQASAKTSIKYGGSVSTSFPRTFHITPSDRQ